MSVAFANKTSQIGLPMGRSVDIGTTGINETVKFGKLGDLTRLAYTRAVLRGSMIASASSTAVIEFNIVVNGVTKATKTFTGGAQEFDLAKTVILTGVGGDDEITLEVNVTTADAGKTAQIFAALDVEHPLVVVG